MPEKEKEKKVLALITVGKVEASTVVEDTSSGEEPLVGVPSTPNVPVWSNSFTFKFPIGELLFDKRNNTSSRV